MTTKSQKRQPASRPMKHSLQKEASSVEAETCFQQPLQPTASQISHMESHHIRHQAHRPIHDTDSSESEGTNLLEADEVQSLRT